VDHITYHDLVERYGANMAYDLLLTFEKLARIKNEIISMEEEERFQKALDALNAIDFAA
jgi:hypothetical protein